MRKRDFVLSRLYAWGWHWADRMDRDQHSQSIHGTLAGSVGGGSPGSNVPMQERDWMRPDVLNTHACVCTLNDIHRAIVWRHFVESSTPVKTHCANMGVGSSVYYQRLKYALRHLARSMTEGVDVENVHMESTPLVRASSGAEVNLRQSARQRPA